MEDFQKKFQALSQQCLSHEVEDHLWASEIRFNRKQFQADYDILVRSFKFLQDKRARSLDFLMSHDEEYASTHFEKQLYCLSKVVEDQSMPPAINYTRKHLEEDYTILIKAFKKLQDKQTYFFTQLSMSQSEKIKSLADARKQWCHEYRIVPPGEVKHLVMASEIKFTRQQLSEDHDTLIKAFKELQAKHTYLLKQFSVRKGVDDEVLQDSKKQQWCKDHRGPSNKQNYESMLSEIRKHLGDEYDTLISAFKNLQARQMSLLEQAKQEDPRKQHRSECNRGLSSKEDYKSMLSEVKFFRKLLENEYDILINAFKELSARSCLLDQQMFEQIKQDRDLADPKKQRRNQFGRDLSEKEHYELCVRRVKVTRGQLEAEYHTLIKAFQDFQARQTRLLREETIRQMKQGKNHAVAKRQYRTEYERGLSNIGKNQLLLAVIPELERKTELLINARKNLSVEAASWLEKLCSKQAVEEFFLTESKKQLISKYMRDLNNKEKVQLPEDMKPQLEVTIERLVTARKNLESEEACLLEKLLSRQRAEEEVQTDSMKQCPSDELKDLLPQAVNAELGTTIELLMNVRKNLETEEACLLEELLGRQPVGKKEALTDFKKLSISGKNPVQDAEQVQDS